MIQPYTSINPPPHPEGPLRRTLVLLRNSAVEYSAVLRLRQKKTQSMVNFFKKCNKV